MANPGSTHTFQYLEDFIEEGVSIHLRVPPQQLPECPICMESYTSDETEVIAGTLTCLQKH
jgi:hypothetical protein